MSTARLSEREEKLLMAHFDGQTSLVGRWRCRRLLSANPNAERFLEDLRRASTGVKQSVETRPCDLWDRVARRIDEEQRAAIFLGKRPPVRERSSKWEPIGWGAAGAALAATVAALMLQVPASQAPAGSSEFVMLPQNLTLEEQLAPSIAPVSMGQTSSMRVPHAVEVEWMRSRGRVKMIQHPEENSTILWVTRNQPNSVAPLQRPARSLVSRRGREPIRILNEDIPTTMSAFDNK